MKRYIKAGVEDPQGIRNLRFAEKVISDASKLDGVKDITGEHDDTYITLYVDTNDGYQPDFEFAILQRDITEYMEDYGFGGLVDQTVGDIEAMTTDSRVNPDGGMCYYNFGLMEVDE